jgi:hypothetical protein
MALPLFLPFAQVRGLQMLRNRVIRGGVEPPTFRFSGVADVQASDVAAAWTVAEVRRRSGSVAVVAVTVAVGSKLCEPHGTARDDGFTDGSA